MSYSEFFWSVFSRIQSEYGEILQKNTDQKNSEYGHFSRSVLFLKILTYTLILGNIKNNGPIISSKYPIKYLELFFVSINFEITILSTSTPPNFYCFFFASQNSFMDIFVSPNLNIIALSEILLSLLFS